MPEPQSDRRPPDLDVLRREGWSRGHATRPAPPGAVRDAVGALVRVGTQVVRLARAPFDATLAIAGAQLGRAISAGEEPGREPLTVRARGRDVEVTPEALAAAYPAASGRLLVLVPPPGADEQLWEVGSQHTGGTYAQRLQARLDWAPVVLRQGPGLTFSEAAITLSSLLQRLVTAWPVPVEQLVLVGAGTGGLAVRGACGVRTLEERPWTDLVTHVVALGTPALGVPGQAVTTGVGRRLDEQLAGVVVVEPAVVDVPPLPGAAYVLVSDELSVRPHRVGHLVGEVMWRRHRPAGRARKGRDLFPTAHRFEVAASPDEPLTNHRDVHRALLEWLA